MRKSTVIQKERCSSSCGAQTDDSLGRESRPVISVASCGAQTEDGSLGRESRPAAVQTLESRRVAVGTGSRCFTSCGVVGVQVGGLDVVTLLGAIAKLPLLGAIADCWGSGRWVYTLADWTWCRCWLPFLGAIAGLPLLGGIAVAGCHC